MSLTIEMHDPEGVIMREIAAGYPQHSIALTYAFLIAQMESKNADWPKINQAIRERWKGRTALERVKKQAWKHVEYWHAGASR